MNTHTPNELVMTGAAVGLVAAGIPLEVFNPAAPLAGCRLCGKVYQTQYHRRLYNNRLADEPDNPKLLQLVLDLNTIWREQHTKVFHIEAEVKAFEKTGWAFTPEAANKLAPFGIIPMGNMHEEIVDGLFTARRAPDLTNLEGGE